MLFYNEVIDAFKFIFSDYKAYFQIGTLLFIISLFRKIAFTNLDKMPSYVLGLLFISSELLLYVQVGYGSYISLYTLKAEIICLDFTVLEKYYLKALKNPLQSIVISLLSCSFLCLPIIPTIIF